MLRSCCTRNLQALCVYIRVYLCCVQRLIVLCCLVFALHEYDIVMSSHSICIADVLSQCCVRNVFVVDPYCMKTVFV